MHGLAAVALFLAATGVAPTSAPTLYDSSAGGFAFEIPRGWTAAPEKQEPFPTLSGPKDDLRAPYVVIHAVKDQRDLFSYADAALKDRLKDSHYQLSRRDAFETADNTFGVKFVFTYSAPGPAPGVLLAYKQAYYLVNGPPGIIYAFLATVPEGGWEKYEPILDDMLRSYRLRPMVAAKPGAAP